MPTLDEIIIKSEENVNALSDKLRDLDMLYQEITALKKAAEGIPEKFSEMFQKVVTLTMDYTDTLGVATKNYLDGSNTLFTTKLSELSTKITEFEKEITRLVNTDFTKLFKDLQKVFIDQTRSDLTKEMKRFEEKSTDLQAKIDELKKQIERLDKIDLEKHFDKLQKTLSEIFGAINSINVTLTNVTQNLNIIVQSLGTIQTLMKSGFEETNSNINRGFNGTNDNINETKDKIIADLTSHINFKSNEIDKHLESQDLKIKSLSEHNELLKKEVKTNRIIQIIGIAVIIIILIYITVKL